LAEPEPIITFDFPEAEEVEIYRVILPDKRVVLRTKEELEEVKHEIKGPKRPESEKHGTEV